MLKGTPLDSSGVARSHGVSLSADRSTGSAISIAEMGRRSAMLPRTSTAGAGSSARMEDAEWAGWDSKVDGGVAALSYHADLERPEGKGLLRMGLNRAQGLVSPTLPLNPWALCGQVRGNKKTNIPGPRVQYSPSAELRFQVYAQSIWTG